MTTAESSNDRAGGWFVLWTESRAEKKVASRIAARGIEPWMPTVTERHRWSDRWRDVVLPLFPGYLFARNDSDNLRVLLHTPGVLTVVKAGDKPAVVPESLVNSLRRAVEISGGATKAIADAHSYSVDEKVVVQEGPLAGLRGVVRQLRGGRHLVIWVEEIGRGAAFTIGEASIAPVSDAALR
jgi:transcription termination/antitermination protein NusG